MQIREPAKQTSTGTTISFHWTHIILPAIALVMSIILIAIFYQKLPAEVAYRFQSDGSPDKWLSRGSIVLWALLPQILLTLLAAALTWGITWLGHLFKQSENVGVKTERVVLLMGNMIMLPQLILFFTMLDIFSYNAYQTHILPLWVITLIVAGVGGIILGVLLIRAIRQVLKVAR